MLDPPTGSEEVDVVPVRGPPVDSEELEEVPVVLWADVERPPVPRIEDEEARELVVLNTDEEEFVKVPPELELEEAVVIPLPRSVDRELEEVRLVAPVPRGPVVEEALTEESGVEDDWLLDALPDELEVCGFSKVRLRNEMFPDGPMIKAADVLSTLTSSVMKGNGPSVDVHGTGMMSTLEPIVVVRVEQADNVPAGLISPSEIDTSGYWACTASNGSVSNDKRKDAIVHEGVIQ